MTQIYRWAELKRGAYSSRENLSIAKKNAFKMMQRLHERGWIKSASIFGSVARGDHSIGSDFDVLVVSNPLHQAKVERVLRRVVTASNEELGVQPGIIHVNTAEAKQGEHSISPFLLNHLALNFSPDASVGENPTGLFKRKPVRISMAVERENLLMLVNSTRKARVSLPHYRRNDSDRYYSELGHALDRPINYARHALDYLNRLPKQDGKLVDSKATVVEEYGRLVGSGDPSAIALKNIHMALGNYRLALTRAVEAIKSGRGRGEKKRYEQAVRDLEKVLPHAELVYARLNRLTTRGE